MYIVQGCSLIRVIEIRLNKAYIAIHSIAKYLSGAFSVQSTLEDRDVMPPLLLYMAVSRGGFRF
jgi:hypothetical protein